MVPEDKLLIENPWNRFPWIEGRKRPSPAIRRRQLLSLLEYLDRAWAGVTVASLLAKVFLWSGAGKEITGLEWQSLRIVGSEYHFAIVGKWGIERWFRIPEGLYQELFRAKTYSKFVFSAYAEQLRQFYAGSPRPWTAEQVDAEFTPDRLGDWFFERIVTWSRGLAKGHATTHIFRKTALQYARQGEDLNRQVAADARVSETVMMTSYVQVNDEELRQASNRTYSRILASISQKFAPVRARCCDPRGGEEAATSCYPR